MVFSPVIRQVSTKRLLSSISVAPRLVVPTSRSFSSTLFGLSKPKTSRLPTTSYTNFNLSNVRLYSGGGALTRDDIRDRIFAVLKDFDKVKQENISETAEFTKDLGLDSLDTVEVVMAIEEEFSVEIPDDDADAINTVQKAIDYIVSCEGAC